MQNKSTSVNRDGIQRGGLGLLAPGRLIVWEGLLLFAFTLFPPYLYKLYVREPNLMFGNPILYLYMAVCLVLLQTGIWLGSRAEGGSAKRLPLIVRLPPFWYLLMPVLVALCLVTITLTIILNNQPWLVATALLGDGTEVKNMMLTATQGAFSGSLPLAIGMCWWSYAQYLSLQDEISRFQQFFCQLLIFGLVVFLSLAFAAMMSRYLLMPLIFGVFILNVRHRVLSGGSMRRLWLRAFWFGLLVIALFGAIASLRNGGDKGAVISSFVGYGPASTNHLAALLDGRISAKLLQDYFNVMNFGFIYKLPFAERMFNLSALFDQTHDAPFNAAWRAGLNGQYIWVTSLGEIGMGLGVFAIPYLLAYGYIVGKSWSGFKSGTTFGLLLYPWSAFCLLFTFGSNYFASRNLAMLLISSGLLWVYSGLVRPSMKRIVGTGSLLKSGAGIEAR